MKERIEAALDARIRPRLALHGGGAQLLATEQGVARIRLFGPCSSCPASCLNAEQDFLETLQEEVPELKRVVIEQSVSEELLSQARELLGRRRGSR